MTTSTSEPVRAASFPDATTSPDRAATVTPAIIDPEFSADWAAWHEAHETNRADGHGFLAITGLNWLNETPAVIDGIPGLWSTSDAGPIAELAEGESLAIDGSTVTGRVEFGVIPERGGRTAFSGDVAIEVARRGGHDIVRPRDPEYPLRTAYNGTPSYQPSPSWVATGRYLPFESPRSVTVGAAVEGLQHVYEAPGQVELELDGQRVVLTVFNGHTPGSLFALFTDATSGVTTYAANRSLAIDAPDADGRVIVDFNRSTNLPCAYTAFATCPLPPAENRLTVAIEAGELQPLEQH